MGIVAAPFPPSFQKRSDWATMNRFLYEDGKHEEPKDKQIYSHCINFTAMYMFMEMKTSLRQILWCIIIGFFRNILIIAESLYRDSWYYRTVRYPVIPTPSSNIPLWQILNFMNMN